MISAIPGVRVGHHTDLDAATGCTVIIPPAGTVGACEVRGGGPGSREIALLDPASGVSGPTALLFTGGSAFGLAAADGVMAWCEEQGLGHDTGVARVPIVPAAVIYDLGLTGGAGRPGPDAGRAAAEAAVEGAHATGCVGAGTGATVGKTRGREGWMKGGVGAAQTTLHDGTRVAALAVVNAFGDIIDAAGEVIAGARDDRGQPIGAARWALENPPEHLRLRGGENTTLACIVTDAVLDKREALQVARMATGALGRAISPAMTTLDGDIVFCLATGARRTYHPVLVGIGAAEVLAEAIRDAARSASGLRGVPAAS